MKRLARWAVLAVFIGALGFAPAGPGPHGVSAQKRDPVTITRMYSGADGLTHFEETNLPFNAPMMKVAGTSFRRDVGPEKSGGPRDAGFEFHNAPHRRYVVTLSGKAEIEASGGGRFIADVNHILLAEDLTGKGHRYVRRPLGNEDWIIMFVEIDQPKPAARPTN